jgi:type I restriction enzyme R subunit
MYRSAADLRAGWASPEKRAEIIERLASRGVGFDELTKATQQPDADPVDLLCHVAFNAPLRTRRERADRLRRERAAFFEKYSGQAREDPTYPRTRVPANLRSHVASGASV